MAWARCIFGPAMGDTCSQTIPYSRSLEAEVWKVPAPNALIQPPLRLEPMKLASDKFARTNDSLFVQPLPTLGLRRRHGGAFREPHMLVCDCGSDGGLFPSQQGWALPIGSPAIRISPPRKSGSRAETALTESFFGFPSFQVLDLSALNLLPEPCTRAALPARLSKLQIISARF